MKQNCKQERNEILSSSFLRVLNCNRIVRIGNRIVRIVPLQ